MPREVVALVSADDLVSAVRVYADRVNDLLRRGGVGELAALEASEDGALGLVAAVHDTPETVVDLAGWWFARSIEAARPSRSVVVGGDGVPGGTVGDDTVQRALASLPDDEQLAVLLRDSYDLPSQAVAVALARDPDATAELTASARLGLAAAYDDRPAPTLGGHTGRTTVDLVSLSRLADGTLEAPRAAPLRRHLATCPACEDVLETLARARRMAAGLPILALDHAARTTLIGRVDASARAVLPSQEAIQRAIEEDRDPGPLISPVLAVVVLVLAVALGVAVAVLTR